MRYGNPTPFEALKELEKKAPELDEILIAPMYPHYAMSSYETAAEYVISCINKQNKNIRLSILKPFYNERGYIAALANTIRPYLEKNIFEAYLFSYHGLPVGHLKKTDPTKNHCYANKDCCQIRSDAWDFCYRHQTLITTEMTARELGLNNEKIFQSFQSRLGKGWIEPYTDKMLEELPKKGVKKLLVISPAFVADCLETLEEIHIRGKNTFLNNGGTEFAVVPCLNTSPQWLDTFASYCNGYKNEYSFLWN
jgi:ferrochelatase